MATIESVPCTLHEMLVKMDPLHNNRVVHAYQKIIRSIIMSIVKLELEGTKRGYLRVDDLEIDENYEANIPKTTDHNVIGYKREFVILMEAIFGKDHKKTLELSNFFTMIRCEREWYRFEQLIYHPLLLSSMERFEHYIDGMLHLQHIQSSTNHRVKDLFITRWNEKVDIQGAVGALENFQGVLSRKEYEDNVWGALEFSRDACHEMNDLTPEEIEEKLSLFFPKLLTQLYTFLIEMYTHVDLRE